MKVTAFNGSPRTDGNTVILLNSVLSILREEGIETEMVQVGGTNIRGCSACYKCSESRDGRCSVVDDELNGFIEKMLAADGILIGSPTYFADITTETKALIDRAGLATRYAGRPLRRKVGAAVIAVRRGGAIHAFDSINHFFLINEMVVPGSSYWNFAVGRDKGDVELDMEGLRTMETLGRNMAWLLRKLASPE